VIRYKRYTDTLLVNALVDNKLIARYCFICDPVYKDSPYFVEFIPTGDWMLHYNEIAIRQIIEQQYNLYMLNAARRLETELG